MIDSLGFQALSISLQHSDDGASAISRELVVPVPTDSLASPFLVMAWALPLRSAGHDKTVRKSKRMHLDDVAPSTSGVLRARRHLSGRRVNETQGTWTSRLELILSWQESMTGGH